MKSKIFLILFFPLLFSELYSQVGSLPNVAVDESACGLDIITKSTRVSGRREEWRYHPTIPTPVTFNVSEFPENCYDVVKAYVWWVISDKGEQLLNPEATITDPEGRKSTVTAFQTGRSRDKGYGEPYTRGFRADVTDYITGNGDYHIDVNSDDYETDGITLFIIYKNYKAAPMFEGHVFIKDGLVTKCGQGFSDVLAGSEACDNSYYGKAFTLISDLQILFNTYNDYDTVETTTVKIGSRNYKISRDFWNFNFYDISIPKGPVNIPFDIIENYDKIDGDCVSWAMMGIYYRTPPCQTCPEVLPVTTSRKSYSICPGTEITLEPSGGDSYEWWSDPPGFTSNEANPTVAPEKDTKYIVKGIRGENCIFGYDTVTVKVFPKPLIDIGPDTSVCRDDSIKIGKEAEGGVPPFQYKWVPSSGLSADNVADPDASPQTETTYYVEATDANGCVAADTINIKVLEGTKPSIQINGDTSFCPCGNVELAADSGYVEYLWSNGDTNRVIFADETGEYTVTARNPSGCYSTSDPVNVHVFHTGTRVRILGASGRPGDHIRLTLVLDSASYLDECKFDDFECMISFNKTIMVPDDQLTGDSIAGDRRFVTFTGKRGLGTTLRYLNFIATLGSVEESDVTVEYFRWIKCPKEPTGSIPSSVRLDSLCKEGGQTRLLFTTTPAMVNIAPNPVRGGADIEFAINRSGYSELYLSDMLGRKVMTLKEGMMNNGQYKINIDLKGLQPGNYLLILNTPDKTVSKLLEIDK